MVGSIPVQVPIVAVGMRPCVAVEVVLLVGGLGRVVDGAVVVVVVAAPGLTALVEDRFAMRVGLLHDEKTADAKRTTAETAVIFRLTKRDT